MDATQIPSNLSSKWCLMNTQFILKAIKKKKQEYIMQ